MNILSSYAPFACNAFVTQSNIAIKDYSASLVNRHIKIAFHPACFNSHSGIILAVHNAGEIIFNDYRTRYITIVD